MGDSTTDITWDGGDLGWLKVSSREGGAAYLPELGLWALLKRTDVDRRVVVDELKPLFGLMRHGTARAQVVGRPYLVVPLGSELVLHAHYSDLKKTEQKALHDEVRALIIYREVLGLRPVKMCVALDEAGEMHVTSVPEVSYSHSQDWVTREAVLRKYWPAGDFERWGRTYLTKLMTSQFQDQLEEVIRRINPDLLWLQSYILNRLALFGVTPP